MAQTRSYYTKMILTTLSLETAEGGGRGSPQAALEKRVRLSSQTRKNDTAASYVHLEAHGLIALLDLHKTRCLLRV
jgi:hypothetical protein